MIDLIRKWLPKFSRPGERIRSWQVALVLLALAGAVLLIAQSYRTIDRELTESALSRRASVSYLAAAVLSEKFDRLVDIGIALATRVRFRELVEAGNWAEASRILSRVPSDFPFIDRITLNDLQGTMTADVPETPVRGQNFAHRDWYQAVIRNGQPYISRIYRRAAPPQANVFVAAVPIKSSKGEMLGILVVQVRTDTFFEWIKGVEVGPGGLVYVVDRRGTLAAHPKFPPQGDLIDYSTVPVVQWVLRGGGGIEIAVNPLEKEQRVVAYEPIAKHGWGVVLEQPAATVFATRDDQLRRILIAYGLILIFVVAVAYLVSRIVAQRRQTIENHRVNAELECRVAERTAELETANKELESYSYSVSHDLRSPLRAIDGYSQMLEEDHANKLDEEGRRLLGVVRESSQKMGALIDDLLAFSKLGRKPMAVVQIDMNKLVREVLRELQAAGGGRPPQINVTDLPAAQADRTLLKQVWVNLLSNAAKFAGKKDAPVIEVSGHNGAAEIVYRVKDNGVGFDMRYYDKLFGVFQRLHGGDEFPGTGVGLAIVHRVVTRHGGRVWAEGKIDEGATFYFALPQGEPDGRDAAS